LVDAAYLSIETMLARADGRCGAWATLFVATLDVPRFQAYFPSISILELAASNSHEGLLVKNWLFSQPGSSGIPGYPYVLGTDVQPAANGIAGQSNNNPVRYFGNHAVVYVNGMVFDPSYGKTYAS